MIFQRVFTPGLAINSYVIGDEKSQRCAIIDPVRDISPYLAIAKENGADITDIIETHVHADFASGAYQLKHALKGKPTIHSSAMGGAAWIPKYADHPVKDGDEVSLGTVRLKALHTPGHTPEHLIWLCYDDTRSDEVPWFAFTGDLLFVGSIGRPDLLGDEMVDSLSEELYNSLFHRIGFLPDFTEIYPAHGAGSLCGKGMSSRPMSSLGYERRFNSSLAHLEKGRWKETMLHDMPAAPAYFPRMKKWNVDGYKLLPEATMDLKALSKADQLKDLFVIDVRSPDAFATGHVENAVNIPLAPPFANWAGAVVPAGAAIAIAVPDVPTAHHVAKQLSLIGMDNIAGYIIMDGTWNQATLKVVGVGQLADAISTTPDAVFVVDVRTPAEWSGSHIASAHHMELSALPKVIDTIPRKGSVAVICGSGVRASIGASLLRRSGFSDVCNVKGGMNAWIAAGFPVVK